MRTLDTTPSFSRLASQSLAEKSKREFEELNWTLTGRKR
jgi:DNA-binding CsgD family transcriptional regulator